MGGVTAQERAGALGALPLPGTRRRPRSSKSGPPPPPQAGEPERQPSRRRDWPDKFPARLRAAGGGRREAGGIAGGARTPLPVRVPSTFLRARRGPRDAQEGDGWPPGRCGAAAARSAQQHQRPRGERSAVRSVAVHPRGSCASRVARAGRGHCLA